MSKLSVKAELERADYVASGSTQASGIALCAHALLVFSKCSNNDCREGSVVMVPGDEGEPIALPE